MRKIIGVAALSIVIVLGTRWTVPVEPSVIDILEAKGLDYSDKRANLSLPGVSAEVGNTLFHEGFAQKPGGGKTKIQSKHFVCTSCHNVVKEDPDLRVSDPQARLEYVAEHDLPFLQGTTMYGAVNRDSYYNGDYYKKYGDLVQPARHDIRGAIQLCAQECAQGRALADWELESILAYLWTLELRLEDVGLRMSEADKMNAEQIKATYLSGSPATFTPPPPDRKAGSGLIGNANNGKLLYDHSCLHCHYEGQYSFLHLDDSKLSFKHLYRHMDDYTRHSIYQVIRWGVPVKSGKASYMPQYPQEKMSDQQLADLRAYISKRAGKS